MKQISLNGNDWTFKEFVGLDWVWRDSEKRNTQDVRWWYKAAVPGSVLNDLIQAGKVPDPNFELNSKLVEWVPERTWIYRKNFKTPEGLDGKQVYLCFDGIDYSGDIYINDRKIGRQEGMFLPFECNVTDLLEPEGENLLSVVIEPAPAEQPQVGRTSLVRTNKTRMNYWWDFCPRMIHQGIWDSVYLKVTGSAKLKDVYVSADLNEGLTNAVLAAEITAEAEDGCEVILKVNQTTVTAEIKDNKAKLELFLEHPKLWQPNGYGEPYQYDVGILLKDTKGNLSDTKELKYGIRKIEFVNNQRCKPAATPFLLKVNGRKIYINGYNWVPIDAMYGVERPEKLHRLMRLARDAHIVMLRVWGGGLIEKDAFYQACAENGILIWQEFIQSSSGIDNKPPESKKYMDMFLAQAESIIKRKRNHTSLAVWCGGNELTDWEGNPAGNEDLLLKELRKMVNCLDPKRKWVPSSPSGGLFSNSMKNILEQPDMLWDVHGPWEHQGLDKHYELYNRGTSLLHTEFGVEGMTNGNTLEKSMAKEHMLPAGKDNEIYFHRGAWWTNEPLVQKTFGGLDTIDKIRTASQYMQYEGLKYAVECNRRRAFQNSGTFPWQFNEPYPNMYCTSSLDYYANPKPAYYGVKNSYAKVLVSASFESASLHDKEEFECRVFASTSLLEEEVKEFGGISLCCEVAETDGRLCYSDTQQINLPENSTAQLAEIRLAKGEINTVLFLVRLKLVNEKGAVVAENEYLFTKEKDFGMVFDFSNLKLKVTQKEEAVTVTNVGKDAALFINVSSDEPLPHKDFLYFDENYFCLLPKESRKVIITSDSGELAGKKLRIESFLYAESVDLQ